MPLHVIHGPPNSGRAGLVRKSLISVLERDPVLVVPTLDDQYDRQCELSESGAVLGVTITTFNDLFEIVARAAGAPPRTKVTAAQRLGAVAAAIAERRGRLGPLRGSSTRPGFARSLAHLFDELQAAGLSATGVEGASSTLDGSAYMADVATLFSGYAEILDRLDRVDAAAIAREAIDRLATDGSCWRDRPVFLYGLDDLTPNQLSLVRNLAAVTDVTVSLPYEEGNSALAARGALLASLEEIGIASIVETQPNPEYTASPLLYGLERNFGAAAPMPHPADGSLTFLRSAGERGEAEAIGAEIATLLAEGAAADQVAIVLRDAARRGPLIAGTLESYGIHTALEAEVPVATTSVGGALIALLDAELGERRASDLLRYLRGPSGASPADVDWFERELRRNRVQTAPEALRIWEGRGQRPPADLIALRATSGPQELAAAVGALAKEMASRAVRYGAGAASEQALTGAELEGRAAGAIATALGERAELEGLAPSPRSLARTIAELTVRVWSGPTNGRVRITDPYRVRAARFDHVFVASLQDGEFPRGNERDDPFLSESQRLSLGLAPRRDNEAEERYLFHTALALPRRRLFLCFRDSDENGAAETRSPFLEDVRRLLDPAPDPEAETDTVEAGLTRSRELARVVHRPAEAPSPTELARALATFGAARAPELLTAVGAGDAVAAAIEERLAWATAAEAGGTEPGPLRNPAVLERLGAVAAYGGTTLERFDECSYRWFVFHELAPERLDPTPDPVVQGTLMHGVLEALYSEPPPGGPLPREETLGAWIERGRTLLPELAARHGFGEHPAERAMLRRVERLMIRFLGEEAGRDHGGFVPWKMEAGFGAAEEAERPVLEIDDWALHGSIDRLDRAPDGRAIAIDYKVSATVSPYKKFEETAKLQLQLYMEAAAELWDSRPVGALYYPLRGTSERRPRGIVDESAAEALAGYGLVKTDIAETDEFRATLEESRQRATAIVHRIRAGLIDRDPGPRQGLRDHNVCPTHCELAPICRRDRAPVEDTEPENGQ